MAILSYQGDGEPSGAVLQLLSGENQPPYRFSSHRYLSQPPTTRLLPAIAAALPWQPSVQEICNTPAMSTVLTASFAVAVTSYEEINFGVIEAGWVPQCGIVPGFCSKIVVALVTGGIGLFICVSVIACSLKILANPCLLPQN